MEPLEPQPGKLTHGEKARQRSGFYILPSLFTAGTLVCGYFAILSTLKATSALLAGGGGAESSWAAFDAAAKALGLAFLMDGFDGRIARLTNSSSDFGREFDSLADVITFGVAPAFLAFAWGVRPVEAVVGPLFGQHLRQLGWIITFGFIICGAARLARFNIASARSASDHRYFVGLPIPAAAAVIAAVVHCRKYAVHDWDYGIGWLCVIGLLSFLMVSRVRYPSFKYLDLRRRRPYVYIILIGITLYAVWLYSEYVFLAMALAYMLSGPTMRLFGRHRSPPPAPREVRAA
ncbi:MAG TPA: CDP-diacylglycerol--serine O-phosphatidyltransferase [Terriglobia bacterium]|nr:CDP-diacylglycerol--serine O-phosphatidyltransferase [Terriglobia bacterium]